MSTKRIIMYFLVCAWLGKSAAYAAPVIAGVDPVQDQGVPDGWTNVLYINEERPFDFTPTGTDHGVLTVFNFWVAPDRQSTGVVTPFVAQPLVNNPFTGDDFAIRAIGTTREAGTDWQCDGLHSFPFHESETIVVQDGWLAGFMSSDPDGLRDDAFSPIPFFGSNVDGWETGTSTSGSGAPRIALNQPIGEGLSGTEDQAYGMRHYQFQIQAESGDVKPPLPAGGKVDGPCVVVTPPDFYAGVHPVEAAGIPDGWTNVLYINEETPFDFSAAGIDEGVLTEFNFWVAPDRIDQGIVTPFVVEPLVENPQTGEDFAVRAIGTTREAGVDWDTEGLQSFPFHDSEQFTVQSGWLAGFTSSDPDGLRDDAMSPIPFFGSNVDGWETGTSTAGSGQPAIALNEPITEGLSGTEVNAYGMRHYQFQIVAEAGAAQPRLQAGDADQDLDFDQLDLVRVQVAGKYLSGQAATWGEGDWDGAPGGMVGSPPAGDGMFDQLDIIAALNGDVYLTGPYAAIGAGGQANDTQTSLGYNANTGEVWVDAPAGRQLTSINVDSAAGIFTGDPALNLGGSFDNDADNNIFKATFGSSFGTLSFGNVAQRGLSEQFVLSDVTAVGSLAGGGDLGQIDLIYVPVPEPGTLVLVAMTILFAFVPLREMVRAGAR